MPAVYIGIGSNLGNKRENCLRAVKLIADAGIAVTKRSSFYETEPWGVRDQPDFINMAIEAQTDIPPERLLEILKEIEKEMGREGSYKWGPRIIDLDILLYENLVINTPELTIPHTLMHEREFVLMPLSEIAPDAAHPVLKKTVREMLERAKLENHM